MKNSKAAFCAVLAMLPPAAPLLWAFALAGCPNGPIVPSTEQVLLVHKRACVAKGEVLIERSQMEGRPCLAIEADLRNFVTVDEDCQAYYGDAGVSTELCAVEAPEEIAPKPRSPGLDGGSE